jgi:hypothetical protein
MRLSWEDNVDPNTDCTIEFDANDLAVAIADDGADVFEFVSYDGERPAPLLWLSSSYMEDPNSYLVGMDGDPNELAPHIDRLCEPNTQELVIRRWAAEGVICRVLGHNWRDGLPGEGEGSYYANYHPGTWYRTCRICGACQSQGITEWQ